jgi:Uma2 family endonuclease
MPVIIPHPPKTMLEVYNSLPEGTLCQLVNNNLVMSPSPLDIHQVILMEIFFQLQAHLKQNKAGVLRIAPYEVHFSKRTILQPDIIFILNNNLDKIEKTGLKGSPDLVIEILSPSTSHLDMEAKKSIYEQFEVKEYFIVEPNSKTVYTNILQNREYKELDMETGKITSGLLNTIIEF